MNSKVSGAGVHPIFVSKARFGDRSYRRRELRFPTIVVTYNLKVDTALVNIFSTYILFLIGVHKT